MKFSLYFEMSKFLKNSSTFLSIHTELLVALNSVERDLREIFYEGHATRVIM